MLCKKCKTAAPEQANICPYCGGKLYDRKKYLTVSAGCAALSALLLIAAPLYITGTRTGLLPIADGEASPSPSAPAAQPSAVVLSTPQPVPSDTEATSAPQPVPTSAPDTVRPASEVQTMLEEVARAAQLYYDKYHEQTDFVSKNGFLYEFSIDEYVQPGSIWDVTDLKAEYKDENVLILYIKPDDLRRYEYLEIDDKEELEIFAAYEVSDGFAIHSVTSPGGIIFREDLKTVLDKYNCDHGAITRFEKDSQQTRSIVYALQMHAGAGELDVRYLAGDVRYAVAVVSPKDNPADIRAYVLDNFSGRWMIMLSNYEKDWKFRNKVNQVVPAMDSAIMPRYNLFTDIKFLRTDFSNVNEALAEQGFITPETGTQEFISGNDEFVYMEYSSGVKYLVHYNEPNNAWDLFPVKDYGEGEAVMKNNSRFSAPPYYLLKQF